MEIRVVTIIGLGLIGGSLAKALKRTKAVRTVIGIDIDKESLKAALSDGVLDRFYTTIDENIMNSDIVFICTPLNKIVDTVKRVIEFVNPNCIITDTGSIKGVLIESIQSIPGEFNFIGGHPMCGSEKSGYKASKGHLFENAYYILTPCNKTSDDAIRTMEKIVVEIGGIPVIIDSKNHDIITGAISHFPHVVAAGMVNLIKNLDCKERYLQKLAAGGFKDITRISSSKPEMWQNIVLNNKECIIDILKKFSEQINQFIEWLSKDDSEKIFDFFNSAKRYRDSISDENVGLITPFYDITVDVEDKPGIIGKIATLLGNNGINIKNINILNNREYSHGCLRLTFSDFNSMEKAYDLLRFHGYAVYKY